MSEKYKIRDQERLYFVTFCVVQWFNVFTRPVYKDLLVESFKYCQENKGLNIFAWCIMTNHIHLIIGRNSENKIEDIFRDFKKYSLLARKLLQLSYQAMI
ncbi:transposase [Ekhidna sp.]|uniref:transposase n=1 Tax=Ekhidna sp. TaxID=2608089 RepID=UPI003CCBBDFB